MTNTSSIASAKNFKSALAASLIKEGYPDYALALNAFNRVTTLREDDETIGKTNGWGIYLNPHLNDTEMSIVARHEILHVLLKHMTRRKGRDDFKRWNIACDAELSNYYTAADLVAISESEMIRDGVTTVRFPEFAEKIAEEIYELVPPQENEEGDGDGEGEGEGEGEGNSSDSDSDGDGNDVDGKGKSRLFKKKFADVGRMSAEDENDLREDIKKAIQEGFKELSDEEKEAVKNGQIQEATGVSLNDDKDGIPLREEPKVTEAIKLKYALRSYFIKQERVDKGRTYKRPHKKYVGSPIIVKARTNKYKPSKTLAIYVDQSDSMSEEKLKKAIAVAESVSGIKRVSVIKNYFDTGISKQFRPGGGTDYNVIFQHAKKNKYTCLAIITDDSEGYFTEDYNVEALWIIGVEPGSKKRYSFSSHVNVKNGTKGKGTITAKKFEISIVANDEEANN